MINGHTKLTRAWKDGTQRKDREGKKYKLYAKTSRGGVRHAMNHFAKTIIAGRITTEESLRVSKICCLQLVGNKSAC